MHEVIGRDAELAVLARFLEEACTGPGILVLEGEAGIGKSTLLRAALDQARDDGRHVLTTRAAASEARLTLAGLADLLGGVDPEILATLPVPQRRAIDAALLRGDETGRPAEPRLLGTALRSVLEGLAAERPVVVGIDDAQWLDPASATVIAYAIRRLPAAPIGVVLARRSRDGAGLLPGSLAVEGAEATHVRVGPVSLATLHHLLAERLGRPVPRTTLVRIHTASRGVPLFAIEIARLIDDIALPPPGEPLPVPGDVLDVMRRRVTRLPARTLEVLLTAAVDEHAPAGAVERAIGRPIERDLATARRLDIAALEGDRIAFAHPMFAAAILGVAGDAARRRAHARMAAVATTAEGRARHRALAVDGPSAETADDLDAAAVEAAHRGSPSAAAELLELAIAATPPGDEDAIGRRRLELAGALQRSGDAARARTILEPLVASPESSLLRARVRIALATILFESDTAGSQVELCEGAIEDAAGHPMVMAHAHAMAAATTWDDFRRRGRHVARAMALVDDVADPDPAILGLILLVRCEDDVSSGRRLDPAVVARALELERRAAMPSISDRFSAALGTWLKYEDDFAGARTWLEHTLQAAIDEGDDGSLPYAVSHFPELELWTGNWAAADAAARRHLELAAATGLEGQRRQAVYNVGLVLVHRGDDVAARALIDPVLAASIADGDAWTEASLLSLTGFLELSLGDAVAASEALTRASAIRDEVGQVAPRRMDADLVESLAEAGDIDRADVALGAAEERARRFGRHSALANIHRARAVVLGARKAFGEALEEVDAALAEHVLAPIAFDRARTLLVLGRLRRRHGERAAARTALEEALGVFDTLDARRWAERARAELDRLGSRRASTDALTDGERRVAELAAAGLTNKEVARRLFVSPKTVEAHLARAYAKLGIESRAQLGAVMARRAGD